MVRSESLQSVLAPKKSMVPIGAEAWAKSKTHPVTVVLKMCSDTMQSEFKATISKVNERPQVNVNALIFALGGLSERHTPAS